MRLARFSLNDSPRYAFVQKDETDGKDYLIELDLSLIHISEPTRH